MLPLRVCHLIPGLAVGGAERSLIRLVGATGDQISHRVVSFGGNPDVRTPLVHAGADVMHMPLRHPSCVANPWVLQRIRAAIRSHDPDLFHAWLWGGMAMHGVLSKLRLVGGAPSVWGVRSGLADAQSTRASVRLASLVTRWLSEVPSMVTFNSFSSWQDHQAVGFPSSRAIVIPNGVQIPSPAELARWRSEIRNLLRLAESSFLVIHVGRDHADKRIDLFYSAADRCIGRRADVFFVQIGGSAAPIEIDSARSILGTKRILRLPTVPHIEQWFAAADLSVLCSARESCPNVVLESMAAETPVVSSDVGDVSRVVDGNGFVLGPNPNVRELANAILGALALGHQWLRRLGEQCRERVSLAYSAGAEVDAYLRLYGALTGVDLDERAQMVH